MLLAGGCGNSYKSANLTPVDLSRKQSKSAVNSSGPSLGTEQILRLMFLDKAYREDPQEVIGELEQKVRREPTRELRVALAELLLLEARKYKKKDVDTAVAYYLAAAEQGYECLFFDMGSRNSHPLNPSYRLMGDIYNQAVSEIISLMEDRAESWEPKDFDYGGTHYHYEVVKEGPGIWNPEVFDYVHNSYEVRVTGLANKYITKGIGASLVGIVERPAQDPNFGRFYPEQMAAYPVSAVLLFDTVKDTNPPSRNVRLVFCDSLEIGAVQIQKQEVPLEADFTTPIGLQFREANPFQIGNLTQGDAELKEAGIYMLEPYRPDKIPVVIVPGLVSYTAKWADMFNDLRGDAELRKRYQFWFFMYPKDLPILYSTSLLRNELNAIRARYDPKGSNPNFNRMVIVGHSMGGLLARGLVQDSGTKFWDVFFKEPFESVNLDADTKKVLKNIMFFEHLPCVKRVIFIATPHHGAPMADERYKQMSSRMVELPGVMTGNASETASEGELTRAVSEAYGKRATHFIALLSPLSLYIQATNSIPLRLVVTYHSIIGTRKSTTVGMGTSDGVVPYESCYLDLAQSEKLVPAWHRAQEHPMTIAEVKRILREHLEKQR